MCQFFIQESKRIAEKLRIGPGMTGKMQPTIPASARINPIAMMTASKAWTCLLTICAGSGLQIPFDLNSPE